MSEESTEKEWLDFLKRLAKVNTANFVSFLKSTGASNTCLSCGHHDISLPQMELIDKSSGEKIAVKHARYDSMMIISDDAKFDLENYKYWVMCENCGYIMTYNASIVLKWVEANE
ncbi:hypothetical protein RX512_001038 [Providencia rettgeri]|uniref:hypothetical protein n=1 Tax=Providencia alcalifaciens TaxID=126385 RepID=UPI0028F58774|nr:hypothetical protein [Providencia alcalifaciens]ELL9148871.1 hypothetical protein [Providencia rettgeri]